MSGKQRILNYLLDHPGEWVHNQTLREVASVDDAPRLLRMLIQDGWDIERRGDASSRLNSTEKQLARGRRVAISGKLRYLILQKCQFRCRACGHGADDGVKLVIDHVVPVDWGGPTTESNLQALCEECNQGKQAWVADQPPSLMAAIFAHTIVEGRIEALFEAMPNIVIPSTTIEIVSMGAQDWQRALRAIRDRTKKDIRSVNGRRAYRYYRD